MKFGLSKIIFAQICVRAIGLRVAKLILTLLLTAGLL